MTRAAPGRACPMRRAAMAGSTSCRWRILKQRAGIELLHVPFRGAAPATQSTVAGDTKVLFSGSASAPLIESGQSRALATSGKRRAKRFSELPTVGEFYPGFAIDIWLGLLRPQIRPTRSPRSCAMKFTGLLSRQDFADKLNVSGNLDPLVVSPADFNALIPEDYEKYGKIVRDLGIMAD